MAKSSAHDLVMLPGIQLEQFGSTDELSKRAAELFVEQFSARAHRSEPFIVALSGGRVSQLFFRTLTAALRASNLPLATLHFFWADERCVAPQDMDSNFAVARSELFDPLGIPESQVHRIEGELPPDQAAIKAEAELCRIAPRTLSGQPLLDLLILGMGEDGHSASLFPNETEKAQSSPAIYRHVVVPKPPPNRITLGFPTIAAARTVLAMVSGTNKHRPLKSASTPECQSPFAKILRSRRTDGTTLVLTDFPV